MRRRVPIPAQEIARLIAEGKTNAEIGQAIGKAKNTVDNYVHRLLRQYQCRNRAQLAATAGNGST